MAIKVSGTTVINDSRSLNNITAANSTTVNSLKAAGLGQTTTWGAVGNVVWGRPQNGTNYNNKATASGIRATAVKSGTSLPYWNVGNSAWTSSGDTDTTSGTWRALSGSNSGNSNFKPSSLWQRIS